MWVYIATVLLIIQSTYSQDANCNFQQDLEVGKTYYVYSPSYPNNYPAGVQCRWVARSPAGTNCRLDCAEVDLPYTNGCTMDRLLISKTGDLQLNEAERYCGRGSVTAVSTGQSLSIGLIVANNSPGGKFSCTLRTQPVTQPPNTCRCGYKKANRIVGGVETGINEFPMMAGLVDVSIYQIKCGAVIINPRAVVSAAHCVVTQTVRNIAVVVGEHNVNTGVDTPATRAYPAAGFTIHPYYSGANNDYDVAIVTIQGEITFSDLVGPVCLPFKFTNVDFTGRYLTALGWGTTMPGGPTSNVLRKVDLQVINQTQCRQSVPQVTNRQICTFTPGKDTCQDDSGGPLLYTDPNTGLLFSIGIVSYGRFCASTEPGISTRVTEVLNWIVSSSPYNYCVK